MSLAVPLAPSRVEGEDGASYPTNSEGLKMKDSSMLLDLKRNVCLRNWEKALHQDPFLLSGWNDRLASCGLIVDLSRVGWVEPDALVRIALLIEGAVCEAGVKVTVRLPLTRPTREEAAVLQAASGRSATSEARAQASEGSRTLNRRQKASAVLEAMQFRTALEHQHILDGPGSISWVDDFDEISGGRASGTDEDEEEDFDPAGLDLWYFDLQVIYPLDWIGDPAQERTSKRIEDLAKVMWHGSGRIYGCDGDTLAGVIVKELAENTIEHSGREFSLLAAWMRPDRVSLKDHEVLRCEEPFAASCRGKPLVGITVGDSGLGIPQVLRRAYDGERPLRETEGPVTEEDQILAWACDKWSTTTDSSDRRRRDRRGTRGLFRVRQIVEKYGGCLTLRAERSYVGYDFGSNRPTSDIAESRHNYSLARSPGTVVHARIPVRPLERLVEASLHRSRTVPKFVDCDVSRWDRRIESISPSVLDVVTRQSRDLKGDEHACIVVDPGPRPIKGDVLEVLLDSLCAASSPHLVVVTGCVDNLGRDGLTAVLEALTARGLERDNTPERPKRDLALYRRPGGTYSWVGLPDIAGSEGLVAKLYDQVLAASGRIPFSVIEAISDDRVRVGITNHLREASHCFFIAEDGFHLRFSMNAIDSHLDSLATRSRERTAGLYLEQMHRFSREEFGAPPALCRTPSLEIVSQFAPTGRVFEALDGTSAHDLDLECAWALARLTASWEDLRGIEAAPSEIPLASGGLEFEIVADAQIPMRLLGPYEDYLRRLLSDRGDPVQVTSTRLRPGDRPEFEEGSVIILFTDVIQSGSTLKRLLSQVVRARRLPDAIVTLVDARAVGLEPVRHLGQEIKTVSLCRARVSVPTGTRADVRIVNIGPDDHAREEPAAATAARYPISAAQLNRWVQDADAMYFQHIARPDGRHFTAFLDFNRMFGSLTAGAAGLNECGESITDVFRKVINEWRGEAALDAVFYPQTERPSAAESVARALAKEYTWYKGLEAQPLYPDWQPSSVRLMLDPRYGLFPDTPAETTAVPLDRVVIVDVGCLSGKTVRRVMRQVAAFAQEVLVVVFLSQSAAEENFFLQQLQGLGTCRVAVRFLARLRMAGFDPPNCPHCQQLERLETERRFYPTGLFQGFVAALRDRLTAHSAEHFRLRSTSDGFDSRDVLGMLRLRELLERAEHSTVARKSLFDRLCEAWRTDSPANRVVRRRLVRLFAAEWTLLKRPPLSMPRFKDILARIAADIISDRESADDECQSAITVLRTGSKKEFADRLPVLFEKLLAREVGEDISAGQSLTELLLYCAFTYLQRDYQVSTTINPLVDSLLECQKKLAEAVPATADHRARTSDILRALLGYGRYQKRRLELRDRGQLTAYHSWQTLQRELLPIWRIPHSFAAALLATVFPHKDDEDWARDNMGTTEWSERLEAWEQTYPFLQSVILPALEPLQKILLGVGESFSKEIGQLTSDPNTDDPANKLVEDYSSLLRWFSQNARFTEDDFSWTRFNRLAKILSDLLANPKDSILARLMAGCPCDLSTIVDAAKPQEQAREDRMLTPVTLERSGLVARPMMVFCHSQLLRACVVELIYNAQKYAQPDGGDPVKVSLFLSDQPDSFELAVRNSGKRNGPVPEMGESTHRGHVWCEQTLNRYGADLRITPPQDLRKPWVYEARIVNLRKWR